MAADLPSLLTGASPRDLVFVVNPRGATGKERKKLLPYLRSRLPDHCDISESLASGPLHATDITREAIRDGADAVIAVGGDRTLHEGCDWLYSKSSCRKLTISHAINGEACSQWLLLGWKSCR